MTFKLDLSGSSCILLRYLGLKGEGNVPPRTNMGSTQFKTTSLESRLAELLDVLRDYILIKFQTDWR